MSLVELAEYLDKQTAKLTEWEKVIHIAYFPSPDALTAAALFGRTLLEMEKPFVIFQGKKIETEIRDREGEQYIFVGHPHEKFHNIPAEIEFIGLIDPTDQEVDERLVNALQFGFKYPEITLTALAYLICEPVAPNIDYILPLPLVAQQLVDMKSKPQGVQKQIHDIALEEGLISEKTTISILGSDIFSINDALLYSQDPFLPDLTDNENRITQLLAKADIVAETNEGYRKFSDLDQEELRELNIAIIDYLSKNTGFRDSKLNFIATKTMINTEEEYTILHNTWDYARAILDVMNRQQYPIALNILLGNRGQKLREMTKIYKEERQALASAVDFLINKREDIIELKHLRYLQTDRKISWYNASLTAAMVLSSGLATIDLPFVIVVPGPEELMTLGIRASNQVEVGSGFPDIVTEIITERDLDIEVNGDHHDLQISIPPVEVENIIMDLNSKLGEIQE